MASRRLRLGVNIDHVATIRNARGGPHPDPTPAARLAAAAGADGITAHLREDRRHISDGDIQRLMAEIDLPLNLEMGPSAEMLEIALRQLRSPLVYVLLAAAVAAFALCDYTDAGFIGVVLLLRVYGSLINTLDSLPLVGGLLELVGLITLTRFSLTRLVRKSDREQVFSEWRQRWNDFRGKT